MSTAAALLSQRVATGFADEKLSDIALRVSRLNAHHIVVIHEGTRKFVGLIRMTDVIGHRESSNRILADLVSEAVPVIVRLNETAESVVTLFKKHQVGEVIVFSEGGTYAGLITPESLLQWSLARLEDLEPRARQDQTVTDYDLSREKTTAGLDLSTGSQSGAPRVYGSAYRDGSANPQAIGSGLRVLLVEDHEASRSALRTILVRRNFTVVEAGSLQEALRSAEINQFDLLISDIGLPDGSGYDLMTILRKQSGITGISMTAYKHSSEILHSKSAGFSYHFSKPLEVEAFLDAIKKIAAAKSGNPTS